MRDTATAEASGSVTTVFAPADAGDGSLGIGFATADGVTATVDPSAAVPVGAGFARAGRRRSRRTRRWPRPEPR